MTENRLERQCRQPNETWAHYMKRNLGREVFSGPNSHYNFVEADSDFVRLTSDFYRCGVYVSIAEKIPVEIPEGSLETLKGLEPTSTFLVGREDSRAGEPYALWVELGDDSVRIEEHDPRDIPQHIVDSIKGYRGTQDIQDFVDFLIDGVRRISESQIRLARTG